MKRKIFNKVNIISVSILLTIICALVFYVFYATGAFNKEPKVTAKPKNEYNTTLRVISDIDYRPYSYLDSKGEPSGYDVELINEVANELQMNLDLRLLSWNDGIEETVNGNADVLMTCDYSDSFPGVEKLTKSEPTSTDDFIVYSKKKISNTTELYSKKVGVMKNGNAVNVLNVLQIEFIEYEDNRAVIEAIKNNEIDCGIIRYSVGNFLLKELHINSIKGYINVGQSYMCYGINSANPELANKINNAIKTLKKNGTVTKLHKKWLTTYIEPLSFGEVIINNLWIVFTFIGIVVIFTATILYNRSIRHKQALQNTQYITMIESLSNDFECVNFVSLDNDNNPNKTELLRISEILDRNIPSWKTETNFSKRLDLIHDTIVAEDDRNHFYKMTRKEEIIKNLQANDVYFVNFKAVLDNEIKYFQLKFIGTYKDGKITSLICGVHNIDAETRRNIALNEELENANNAKTDFLFNMSHDIRTPMNAIIGFTNIAKKHPDNKEKVEDCLNKIETSGNHLLELINEVLDMSRVEAGKLKSDIKLVSIKEEAKKLVTICKETATERNIKLIYNDSNLINYEVLADELHINQIIMNILGNAIKYTLPGGTISYNINELRSDIPGYGKYEFVIEDNGIGMSKEFLGKIFESFSREENETIRNIQGTGLGMSIVKRLVDYLDGNIDIQSELGKGTKVTVTLHLKLSNANIANTSLLSNKKVELKGLKALLVEDNDLNREIAIDLLNELGFEVEEARNGAESVEIIEEKGASYFDVVLMDIQMPIMNGYEATMEIRKLPDSEKLVIIALSANAFEEDKAKSLKSGMNDHIAKPINPELLKNSLQMHLANKK